MFVICNVFGRWEQVDAEQCEPVHFAAAREIDFFRAPGYFDWHPSGTERVRAPKADFDTMN